MTTNFEMYAGNTRNLVITVRDSAHLVPVDLTGASVRWVLKSTPELSKSSQNGGVLIEQPLAGIFVVQLTGADTAGMAGIFAHGAEITDALGNVSTVLIGTARIIAGV